MVGETKLFEKLKIAPRTMGIAVESNFNLWLNLCGRWFAVTSGVGTPDFVKGWHCHIRFWLHILIENWCNLVTLIKSAKSVDSKALLPCSLLRFALLSQPPLLVISLLFLVVCSIEVFEYSCHASLVYRHVFFRYRVLIFGMGILAVRIETVDGVLLVTRRVDIFAKAKRGRWCRGRARCHRRGIVPGRRPFCIWLRVVVYDGLRSWRRGPARRNT